MAEPSPTSAGENAFVPFLWAQVANEKRPSSIAMVALAGADFFRRMSLNPSPEKDELEMVGQAVHAHFRHWRGCAGPWGEILGYTYHRSPAERWLISTDGQVVSREAERNG